MSLATSSPHMPAPPRLHWGVVLLLTVVTWGFFGLIWLYVQARWVKRVRGKSLGQKYIFAWLGVLATMFIGAIVLTLAGYGEGTAVWTQFDAILRFAGVVICVLAVFGVRSDLLNEPFNIPLSGVMTFFFGPTYFQYWLRDFNYGQPTLSLKSAQPQWPPV